MIRHIKLNMSLTNHYIDKIADIDTKKLVIISLTIVAAFLYWEIQWRPIMQKKRKIMKQFFMMKKIISQKGIHLVSGL